METEDKITVRNCLWYFTVFSILGLLIETTYCYITTGVIESRKGLLIGPFCPIYGVGATILIILLSNLKNSKLKLFLFGGITGDLIEYVISYGLEAMYSMRFWDYSYTGTDLNGRICITYTIFWGTLSVILISFAKPIIDKLIKKTQFKHIHKVEVLISVFFIFDAIITVWGLNVYQRRAINKYYGITQEKNSIQIINYIEDNIFNDKYIYVNFPNVRFRNNNNEEIWIKDLV